MASEVDRLIKSKTNVKMNLSENHIRCFTHKLALILNAGLKAITITPKGLILEKESVLGYVPGLSLISEDNEEILEKDRFDDEDIVEEEIEENSDDDKEHDEDDDGQGGQGISAILKKVSYILYTAVVVDAMGI
jgi:hypothetical protein